MDLATYDRALVGPEILAGDGWGSKEVYAGRSVSIQADRIVVRGHSWGDGKDDERVTPGGLGFPGDDCFGSYNRPLGKTVADKCGARETKGGGASEFPQIE